MSTYWIEVDFNSNRFYYVNFFSIALNGSSQLAFSNNLEDNPITHNHYIFLSFLFYSHACVQMLC